MNKKYKAFFWINKNITKNSAKLEKYKEITLIIFKGLA
ncbi:putative small multi-drug export protein [Clostridium botulinum A3 str. Loch Maree]|nr:putative small multi-drug export protein [Clostridium botulinum A3 str. Loch Maree]